MATAPIGAQQPDAETSVESAEQEPAESAAAGPGVAEPGAAAPPSPEGPAPAIPLSSDGAAEPDGAIAEAESESARLPDSWFEARLAIEELAETGDYEAALELGPRLLELVESEFGPDTASIAEAHLLIASVHQQNGEHFNAEENILEAISIYERVDGPLSVTLIDPYLELGNAYQEAGDHTSAITAYSEARTIGRRAYGLLNEDQLPIIDEMSESAIALGDGDTAEDLQVEAMTVVQRSHGEFSIEAIEARYKYAAWLRSHRRFQQERRQYDQIARIAERDFPGKPLLRVRALRERANSFRAERNGESLGLNGLHQALEIVTELPEPEPLAQAEVLRDIGDWDVAFNRIGASGEEYIAAWRLLAGVENGDELRERWFENLAIVYLAPLSRRGLSRDPSAPRGRVVVRFTVDESGRTSDIVVAESNPPGFKDAAAIRQIRASRFRPRVINGQLVSARHALALDFQYDPEAAGPDLVRRLAPAPR